MVVTSLGPKEIAYPSHVDLPVSFFGQNYGSKTFHLSECHGILLNKSLQRKHNYFDDDCLFICRRDF